MTSGSTLSQSGSWAVDNELLVKSTHLLHFRLAFAAVSLILANALALVSPSPEQLTEILHTALAVAFYSGAALIIVKRARADQKQLLQTVNGVLLLLDVLCLSLLVHGTKGVESDLYFLYLLPTVLASQTFSKRGVFATAFGAALLYLGVLVWENYSFIPYLLGATDGSSLTTVYAHSLWARILTRAAMLMGVSVVWAIFCDHMSQVAQQGASRLRRELTANHRLVAETTALVAREQMMNAVASAIRSTLDINQVLSTTVAQLITALGVSRCAIITPSESIGQAPLTWEASAQQAGHESARRSFSRPLCEYMLENLAHYVNCDDGTIKKTFAYENLRHEPVFAPIFEELEKLGFVSLLVQPIIYGGDSRGVIVIGECHLARRWSESEIELTKAVSAQVSIALEHASLVDQLSRKNRDLLQKNLHLDAKNLELRTMQSQLVHQEKMASLGRMVAGIAHELNNPVNFVHGNLPYLREYLEDLKKIIAVVDELPADYKQSVDKLKQDLKYEFLITDLDHIVADLAEGAERIRQIIKNLRSFSRLDEAELKEASIQEGIESTIKILSQYYGRDKIQPQCQFADIPPVVCYPGKLNQVWMNLLSNAAQAVAEVERPEVGIVARLEDKWVLVSISDNGTGVKPQDQSKIFEPFYTTKPVGQGTGLGLSICHSIIERHGGTIWFESKQGQGTTFNVKIPLKAEPEPIDEAKEVAMTLD